MSDGFYKFEQSALSSILSDLHTRAY